MKRIDSIEDIRRGVATYELADGQLLTLNRRQVDEYGAASILKQMGYGHLVPIERVPVIWCGRQVGTLPPDFDPSMVSSASPLYDPRPGDFRREGDAWVADKMLGAGDLAAIRGFVWSPA